jgi:hypothetical protein
VTGATNTVNLAGATLNAVLGYDPAANDRLFIVDNQTNNAVSGTFAGLPSGSTFQLTNPGTGHSFNATIFYAADTSSMGLTGGNDVVIQFMPVPEPAAVFVFAAAGLVAARGWRRVARG